LEYSTKRAIDALLDSLLSFFVPYPGTPLYWKRIEVGFPPLPSLEVGDFDQFDCRAIRA